MRTTQAARRLFAAAAIAGLFSTGCPNTDPAVFVDAAIDQPAAHTEKKTLGTSGETLGTSLGGGFILKLHLGARASGASEVRIQKLTITNEDRTATVVDPLEVTTDEPFPVTVDPDSDVAVAFTFGTGAGLLPADTYDALCQAGGLRITGTIQDSLQEGATPLESGPFSPSGCP